jgi:hypothetical protein
MQLELDIQFTFLDLLCSITPRYPYSVSELHYAETTSSASQLEGHFQVDLVEHFPGIILHCSIMLLCVDLTFVSRFPSTCNFEQCSLFSLLYTYTTCFGIIDHPTGIQVGLSRQLPQVHFVCNGCMAAAHCQLNPGQW